MLLTLEKFKRHHQSRYSGLVVSSDLCNCIDLSFFHHWEANH